MTTANLQNLCHDTCLLFWYKALFLQPPPFLPKTGRLLNKPNGVSETPTQMSSFTLVYCMDWIFHQDSVVTKVFFWQDATKIMNLDRGSQEQICSRPVMSYANQKNIEHFLGGIQPAFPPVKNPDRSPSWLPKRLCWWLWDQPGQQPCGIGSCSYQFCYWQKSEMGVILPHSPLCYSSPLPHMAFYPCKRCQKAGERENRELSTSGRNPPEKDPTQSINIQTLP